MAQITEVDDTVAGDHVDAKRPLENDSEPEDEPQADSPVPSQSEGSKSQRVSREQPPPGLTLKKLLLIGSTLFVLWLAYALGKHYIRKNSQPQIIYASRCASSYETE